MKGFDDRATQPNPDGADGSRVPDSQKRDADQEMRPTCRMGHLDNGSSNQWYGHQSMCSNAIEGGGQSAKFGLPQCGAAIPYPTTLPHRLPCPGYRNTVRSAGQSAVL